MFKWFSETVVLHIITIMVCGRCEHKVLLLCYLDPSPLLFFFMTILVALDLLNYVNRI